MSFRKYFPSTIGLLVLLSFTFAGQIAYSKAPQKSTTDSAFLKFYTGMIDIWGDYQKGNLKKLGENWKVTAGIHLKKDGSISTPELIKKVSEKRINTLMTDGILGFADPFLIKPLYKDGGLRSATMGVAMTKTKFVFEIELTAATEKQAKEKLLNLINTIVFAARFSTKDPFFRYVAKKMKASRKGKLVTVSANLPISEVGNFLDIKYENRHGVKPKK